MVLFSGGKISAYAPKSRFSFVYDALGFSSALQSDEKDVRGNKLTPEQVAKLNPDWLFVIDRDAATGRPNAVAPQKILTGTALKKTTAVKKARWFTCRRPRCICPAASSPPNTSSNA